MPHAHGLILVDYHHWKKHHYHYVHPDFVGFGYEMVVSVLRLWYSLAFGREDFLTQYQQLPARVVGVVRTRLVCLVSSVGSALNYWKQRPH
jgi:hypothetical protein